MPITVRLDPLLEERLEVRVHIQSGYNLKIYGSKTEEWEISSNALHLYLVKDVLEFAIRNQTDISRMLVPKNFIYYTSVCKAIKNKLKLTEEQINAFYLMAIQERKEGINQLLNKMNKQLDILTNKDFPNKKIKQINLIFPSEIKFLEFDNVFYHYDMQDKRLKLWLKTVHDNFGENNLWLELLKKLIDRFSAAQITLLPFCWKLFQINDAVFKFIFQHAITLDPLVISIYLLLQNQENIFQYIHEKKITTLSFNQDNIFADNICASFIKKLENTTVKTLILNELKLQINTVNAINYLLNTPQLNKLGIKNIKLTTSENKIFASLLMALQNNHSLTKFIWGAIDVSVIEQLWAFYDAITNNKTLQALHIIDYQHVTENAKCLANLINQNLNLKKLKIQIGFDSTANLRCILQATQKNQIYGNFSVIIESPAISWRLFLQDAELEFNETLAEIEKINFDNKKHWRKKFCYAEESQFKGVRNVSFFFATKEKIEETINAEHEIKLPTMIF